MTTWEIKAKEFANCNCSYGCPCQFNALPTHGFCEAAVALEIEEGHYGEVKLDALRMGGIFQWPGPVHEGHGKCQPFVDERADGEQREALLKIMSGQDTEPMATMFAVFSSTLEKVYDPIFAKIDFNVDVEGRRGRYAVADLIESEGEPIKNPVTGAETRARIDLPNGFESICCAVDFYPKLFQLSGHTIPCRKNRLRERKPERVRCHDSRCPSLESPYSAWLARGKPTLRTCKQNPGPTRYSGEMQCR